MRWRCFEMWSRQRILITIAVCDVYHNKAIGHEVHYTMTVKWYMTSSKLKVMRLTTKIKYRERSRFIHYSGVSLFLPRKVVPMELNIVYFIRTNIYFFHYHHFSALVHTLRPPRARYPCSFGKLAIFQNSANFCTLIHSETTFWVARFSGFQSSHELFSA